MSRSLAFVPTLLALATFVAASAFGADKFACEMGALTKAERTRYRELSRALLESAAETKELPNGYAFRFKADDLTRAAEWVSLERKCCPFFTFELEQSRDGGPLWLRITGTEGVKAFIEAEFGLD